MGARSTTVPDLTPQAWECLGELYGAGKSDTDGGCSISPVRVELEREGLAVPTTSDRMRITERGAWIWQERVKLCAEISPREPHTPR